jgi:hypothetical protein
MARKRKDGGEDRRNPPTDQRYKPGQTGNPKGRPKGSKSDKTLLEKELSKKVTIVENGQTKRVTKRELFFKQITNKGVAGDPRFGKMILDKTWPLEEAKASDEKVPSEIEALIVEELVARMKRAIKGVIDV